MSRFLAWLLRYKGLTVYSPGLVGRLRATNVMREHRLDFDDALIVQKLRDLSRKTVVSYDGHLDGIDGIDRETPEQLLSDL
jgi:predicted nucleic acid-binding protein